MKKVCCVFNIPSLYREAIYLEIDREYDCKWFFEDEKIDIALFDATRLNHPHFLKHKRFLGRTYLMKGLVRSVMKEKDIDVYLMVGTPLCISIWVLCLFLRVFYPKKKIVFWTHGWYGKETRSERFFKRLFLHFADELILYGNYAKGLLEKEGFKAEKMHVIHNSLSYDIQYDLRKNVKESSVYKDHFGNSNQVVIFIGRLTPVKNLTLLLDAFLLLNKRKKYYNLVFVGDGVERENLERKTIELGLSDQVWFYGSCYDESTNAELIYNADVCVAPGNIGLTAVHVLMFGCPAITHNDFAYQMPEFEAITPLKTGGFYSRGDALSLANCIEDWFEVNGAKRERVREHCYNEIDNGWTPKYQMGVLKAII